MDLMALINGTVNFIIYSLMSTQFRQTLATILPLGARHSVTLLEVLLPLTYISQPPRMGHGHLVARRHLQKRKTLPKK